MHPLVTTFFNGGNMDIKYDFKKVENGKYDYWLNNNVFLSIYI